MRVPVAKAAPARINVLLMAGVGGTGKGMMMNRAKEVYGDLVHVLPSTNRAAAAEAGFKSEKELNSLSGKERTEVQKFIFNYYSKAVVKAVREAVRLKATALICERSPADYMSYLRYAAPMEYLTNHEIDTLGTTVTRSIVSAIASSSKCSIMYLPWPPSWYGAGTQDGFRQVNHAKDSELDIGTLTAIGTISRHFLMDVGIECIPKNLEDLDGRMQKLATVLGLDQSALTRKEPDHAAEADAAGDGGAD